MSHRTLDISSISAKYLKLKKVSCFSNKMGLYATVSIDGSSNSSEQKTPIDKDGGSNPIWNSPMKFIINDVPAAQQTIVVKLKAERIIQDKVIGRIRVPMEELLDNYGDSKGEKSYQLYCCYPQWEGQRGTGSSVEVCGAGKLSNWTWSWGWGCISTPMGLWMYINTHLHLLMAGTHPQSTCLWRRIPACSGLWGSYGRSDPCNLEPRGNSVF